MNESQKFDPYHRWFGIPAKDQPPDHYRLLRIPTFEADPEVIENAYEKDMADLKAQEHGQHIDYVEKLSRELITARNCLLDRAEKSKYDAKLQTELNAVEESQQQADRKIVEAAVKQATKALVAELNELRLLAEQASGRHRQASLLVKRLRVQLAQHERKQSTSLPPTKEIAAERASEITSSIQPKSLFQKRWPVLTAGAIGFVLLLGLTLLLLIPEGNSSTNGNSDQVAATGLDSETRNDNELPEAEAESELQESELEVTDSTDNDDPEVNTLSVKSPSLEPVSDKTVEVGEEMAFSARVKETELPASDLRFSLISGPPGATINETTGLFQWMPQPDQAGKSYQILLSVFDASSPTRRDERSFVAKVNDRSSPVRPSTPSELGRYISERSVLAGLNPSKNEWNRLATNSSLITGDELLVLPFYRPSISIGSSVQLDAVGPAQIQLLNVDQSSTPMISFSYGQALLKSLGKPGATVGLKFGKRQGVVTFDESNSTLAIDVEQYLPPGSDPESVPARTVVQLTPVNGTFNWTQQGNSAALHPGFQWTIIGDQPGQSESVSDAPAWVSSSSVDEVGRLAAEALEAHLDESRVLTKSLEESIEASKIEVRALAAASLAYLGHCEPALTALNDSNYRSFWKNLVDALTDALARSPDLANTVRSFFEVTRPADAKDVYRMLWGYSPQQLADGADEELIEYLNHDSLSSRVVALENLRRITGKTYLYRPEASKLVRAARIRYWREKLDAGEINYRTTPLLTSAATPSELFPPDEEKPATRTRSSSPPERIVLTTDDAVDLNCIYYPGKSSKQTVPVMLIHGWDGSSREFSALAAFLQEEGHAVIAFDLRGHGQSKVTVLTRGRAREKDRENFTKADLALMVKDFIRVKRFLLQKNNAGELNINLLCVVGAEEGSLFALNWVIFDWSYPDLLRGRQQGKDPKAIVMLTPMLSFKGLTGTALFRNRTVLTQVRMLVFAGQDDNDGTREAKRIQRGTQRANDASIEIVAPDTELRGCKLVDPRSRLSVANQIAEFIEKHIGGLKADPDYQWTERKFLGD